MLLGVPGTAGAGGGVVMEHTLVTDPTELVWDLSFRDPDVPIPLDTETTDLFMYEGDRVLCGSLFFGGRAYVFDTTAAPAVIEELYRGRVIFHNSIFDRAMIEQSFGLIVPDDRVSDTLTTEWCLRESWTHALKEIAGRLWGHDEKYEQKKLNETLKGATLDEAYKMRRVDVQVDIHKWSESAADSRAWARRYVEEHPRRHRRDLTLEEWGPYSAKDAELTQRLHDHQQAELTALAGHDDDVGPALAREFLVDGFCYRLQRTGVKVNEERVTIFAAEAERMAAEIAADPIFEGTDLRSRKLPELVYDSWGFECARITESGERSVDKQALEPFSWHPGVARLREFKKADSALSKFYRPLLAHLAVDGRIHASFRSHGTETGRFSSAGPNLQQLPRGSTNRRVRPLFEPEPGMELVEFDLEQAELRIGAALSGERSIIETVEAGGSIYTEVAKEILGRDRQTAKMFCLAAQYGIGPRKLSQQLALGTGAPPDPMAARRHLDAYWSKYRHLKRAIDSYSTRWERAGYLAIGERWPGRLRHREGPFGPEPSYAGFNAVVQGGQAELLKSVLLDLEKAVSDWGRIVLTVHDSIVLEVEPGAGDKVGTLIAEITADHNPWDVPLRWSRKDWEPAPCWLSAPGMPTWLCQLPFGHRGDCDHIPYLDE